ncbi:MAG TPA: endolytic transglycosylase MltG [Gemmatimonadaceae bacterium]|nr:endolytic transglycosylase MltG [Gemmatimonadaceae bacterium]
MLRSEARAAIVATALALTACGGTPQGTPTRVIIPRGASFGQATDSLAKAHLISWPKLFKLYARATGGDRRIKPGTYLLRHDTPWKDIVSALNGGHGLVNTITIPEGFSLSQINPLLARTLHVSVGSVDSAVRDTALLARLDVPTPTLEGYLFPDTYAFPVGTTGPQAVREMVFNFERHWKKDWDQKALDLKINRNDLVTMASIVEREAIRPEERPVIAAVYYNRLRKGMLLQADPTVQYALGHHVGRVLYKDLQVQSPYNTYVNKGLPPGPIAAPGTASLAAAANPANVPYLYFVASPDGHHEFRMTLAEHTNAIREVRGLTADTVTRKVAALPAKTPTKRSSTTRPKTTTSTKKPSVTTSKLTSTAAKRPVRKAASRTTTTKKKTTTTKRKKPA